MRKGFLFALAALALLAGRPTRAEDDPDPGPKVRCEFHKPDDVFALRNGPGGVVLNITSKRGIGGATLTVTAGEMPQRFTIQFVGMTRLESFAYADGKLRVPGRYTDGKLTASCDREGKPVADRKAAALSVTLDAKKDPTRIEVQVEYAAGVKPGKVLRLSWIDAYRR